MYDVKRTRNLLYETESSKFWCSANLQAAFHIFLCVIYFDLVQLYKLENGTNSYAKYALCVKKYLFP